jgi:hypothetical protein
VIILREREREGRDVEKKQRFLQQQKIISFLNLKIQFYYLERKKLETN